MMTVPTPGGDLWQSVADTTGWVKLTRPDDFDVPAPLARQIAERWVRVWQSRNGRNANGFIWSHVQSDDELYLNIALVGGNSADTERLKAVAAKRNQA